MSSYVKIYALFQVLLLLVSSLSAGEFRFQRYTNENGLPQNSVVSILQDHQGFLWLATHGGVCRYDGYAFKVFKHRSGDSTSLGNNYLNAIYEDSDGNIWVGTWRGGLNRFDRNTETFVRYTKDAEDSNSFGDDSALWMLEDSKKRFWVGTIRGGLIQVDREKESFHAYTHDPEDDRSISWNTVTAVAEDRQGNLWVGTGGRGLNLLNESSESVTFERFYANYPNPYKPKDAFRPISQRTVVTIAPDPKDENLLWIGTYGGLVKFDIPSKKFTQIFQHNPQDPTSLSHDRVYALYFDHEDRLWVATFGGGLCLLNEDGQSFTQFKNDPDNPYSISDDKVISIFEDRSGNMWFGTHKVGMNKLSRQRNWFEAYRKIENDPQSLTGNFVTAILEDHQGHLWVGTQEGLNELVDGKVVRRFQNQPNNDRSLSYNWVYALHEDINKQLWVGTFGGGLNLLNRERGNFQRFRGSRGGLSSIFDDRILTLAGDNKRLWIGMRGGGLNHYEYKTGRFKHYLPNDSVGLGPSSNIIRNIAFDTDGALWLATNNGLNKFDPDKGVFSAFFHDPDDTTSLNDNALLSTMVDSKNNIWVGSLSGLNRFLPDTESFQRFEPEKTGGPSTVYGILEANDGFIWLSTTEGIYQLNPETEQFTVYDASDGLLSNEFNVGAFFKSKNGKLYFGGIKGLNAFLPENLSGNPFKPQLALTDFRLLNKSVTPNSDSYLSRPIGETEAIQLPYREKVLSFGFAALEFTASDKNQYAYKLEGFDQDWIYSEQRRFATYTNLDPGSYVFRVKGSNNRGVWNEEGRSLRIDITPPFWMTLWFRLLLIAALAGIVYAVFRQRIKRLEAEKANQERFSRQLLDTQESERKRIARELHDSLGQNLLVIKNGLIQLDGQEGNGKVEQLADITDQALTEVREISADLHPYQLDRLGLNKTIAGMVRRVSESSGIILNFESDELRKKLSKKVEINLYRVIQEAVNNIIKHSGASEGKITIALKDEKVNIDIKDNGQGFVVGQKSKTGGLGLTGMAERLKIIDGELKITSAPGEGSLIEIFAPTGK